MRNLCKHLVFSLLTLVCAGSLRAQTEAPRHGNMWFQWDNQPLAISFASPDSAVAVDTFPTGYIQGGICDAEGNLEFYMHSPHMITHGEVAQTAFYTSILNNAAPPAAGQQSDRRLRDPAAFSARARKKGTVLRIQSRQQHSWLIFIARPAGLARNRYARGQRRRAHCEEKPSRAFLRPRMA